MTFGEALEALKNGVCAAGKKWACVLCRILDRIDPEHCDRSLRW